MSHNVPLATVSHNVHLFPLWLQPLAVDGAGVSGASRCAEREGFDFRVFGGKDLISGFWFRGRAGGSPAAAQAFVLGVCDSSVCVGCV